MTDTAREQIPGRINQALGRRGGGGEYVSSTSGTVPPGSPPDAAGVRTGAGNGTDGNTGHAGSTIVGLLDAESNIVVPRGLEES